MTSGRITVLIFVITFLAACSERQSQGIPTYRLEISGAFPSEDLISEDNYLAVPISIAQVGDSLFVVDVKRNEIVRYRTNGDFLGIVGRTGDGPGEFRELVSIVPDLSGAGLWIQSHAGMKFQHLSRNGEYLGGFYPPFPAYEFSPLTDSTMVLVCEPNNMHGSLVCVSHSGEVRWTASPILEINGITGFVLLTNMSYVVLRGDEIWQIYSHFNIVRIFSESGNLLRESSFKDELVIQAHEENVAKHMQKEAPRKLFHKPRAAHGYIWIQAYLHLFDVKDPLGNYSILQVNDAGEVIARYFADEEEPLLIIDILPLSIRPHTSIMLLTLGAHISTPQVINCSISDIRK